MSLLKPGGTLVYSTCTITLSENEDQVAWALKTFPCLQIQAQVTKHFSHSKKFYSKMFINPRILTNNIDLHRGSRRFDWKNSDPCTAILPVKYDKICNKGSDRKSEICIRSLKGTTRSRVMWARIHIEVGSLITSCGRMLAQLTNLVDRYSSRFPHTHERTAELNVHVFSVKRERPNETPLAAAYLQGKLKEIQHAKSFFPLTSPVGKSGGPIHI